MLRTAKYIEQKNDKRYASYQKQQLYGIDFSKHESVKVQDEETQIKHVLFAWHTVMVRGFLLL